MTTVPVLWDTAVEGTNSEDTLMLEYPELQLL